MKEGRKLTPQYLIRAFAGSSLFAGRAFLPAFLAALVLRYPGITEIEATIPHDVAWFVSNTAIIILGILSLFEILADKNSEIRKFMQNVNHWLKGLLSLAANLAIFNNETIVILNEIIKAEFSIYHVMAIIFSLFTVFLSVLRSKVIKIMFDLDEDDDTGLHFYSSILEDLLIVIGFILVIVFPLLVVIITFLIIVAVFLIESYFKRKEKSYRIGCESCGVSIHPSAIQCPSCRIERLSFSSIGAFGQPKATVVNDAIIHRMRLLSLKRCPSCAEILSKRIPIQTCSSCRESTFDGYDDVSDYIEFVKKRCMNRSILLMALGFIPIVGAISALIMARMMIVRPFKKYIPRFQGLILKTLAKIAIYIIIIFQAIPLIGVVSPFLILIIYYAIWKKPFYSTAMAQLAKLPTIPPTTK